MRGRLLILTLLFTLVTANAQQHYAGFDIAGAAAWQRDQIDLTKARLGGGWTAGAVYEFQYTRLLLKSGIDVSMNWLRLSLGEHTVRAYMYDTEGIPFYYQGILTNRQDLARTIDLQIPLQVGFEIDQFYILAGARFCFNIAGHAEMKANLKTSGDYDGRYYDVLEDMPDHGFHDFQTISNTSKIRFRPDIRIEAEAGAWFSLVGWRENPTSKLRIGAYFQYGLMDVNKMRYYNGSHDLAFPKMNELDLRQYMQIHMNHVYASEESRGSFVKNMEVGVRFTFIFPYVIYDENHANRNRNKRRCSCEK